MQLEESLLVLGPVCLGLAFVFLKYAQVARSGQQQTPAMGFGEGYSSLLLCLVRRCVERVHVSGMDKGLVQVRSLVRIACDPDTAPSCTLCAADLAFECFAKLPCCSGRAHGWPLVVRERGADGVAASRLACGREPRTTG